MLRCWSSLVNSRLRLKDMNFELLWTWQIDLRTHSKPGLSTKAILSTYGNPLKKPKPGTCSAGNWLKLGPNLEKLNFKLFQIHVRLPKPKYKPAGTLETNTSFKMSPSEESNCKKVFYQRGKEWLDLVLHTAEKYYSKSLNRVHFCPKNALRY